MPSARRRANSSVDNVLTSAFSSHVVSRVPLFVFVCGLHTLLFALYTLLSTPLQSAELAVSNKFKHLVGDLRKSWEEEEASRAKQLEERLRNHYSAVLEHMESQLQM